MESFDRNVLLTSSACSTKVSIANNSGQEGMGHHAQFESLKNLVDQMEKGTLLHRPGNLPLLLWETFLRFLQYCLTLDR